MLHHMSSGKCKLKQEVDITTHLSEGMKCRTLTTANVGEDVENRSSHSFLGMQNGKAALEGNFVASYRTQPSLCTRVLVAHLGPTLQEPMDCSPLGLCCPWDSPRKTPGVYKHSFLQRIFLTQGLNLSLLHYRRILYCLSHQGSWQVIVLISIYPKKLKTSVPTEICTWVFMTTLFIIAKACKQPRCPSIGERISKLQ